MAAMTSVELHRYIGPADSLGRCIIGETVTFDEFRVDGSLWVNAWIDAGIFQQLVAMSRRPVEQRRTIEA
jgi:hypothetical protein